MIVRGKLSAREEEEPKLLVSAIEKAPSPETLPPPAPERKAVANPGLYLRVPSADSIEWTRAKRLLRVLEGDTPVYVRMRDSGKLMRAPRELWVTPHEVLIRELETALGVENVAKMC